MLASRTRSIERKVSLAVLAAVSIAVIVGALASAWRETERRFANQRDLALSTATTVAASVAAPLAAQDQLGVARSVNVLRTLSRIRYAAVIDRDGSIVFDAGNGIVLGNRNEPLAANASVSAFSSLRLGTYLAAVPVVFGGERIGSLALVTDLTELQNALFESLIEAVLAGIVAALIALVAVSKLTRTITAPILALTAAAQDIRHRHDYTQTVAKIGDDETGVLVEAFNALMGEVAQRDRDLLAHRDDLARQVAERTHDLSIARDVAVQANAAKSLFLATISHEIRTPMNGMIVTTELLAEEVQSPRAKRQCGVVLRSAQTLLAIINDVLDLSKIEAGQLTLDPLPCTVAGVAEDVVELFAQRAVDAGLQIACYVATDVPDTVICDPLRLRQILTNLVNNALKFTTTGGVEVRVTMAQLSGTQAHLRFAVRDTGIGIAPDVMRRLFQPFVQADASTFRRYGGTGIGLAICRRLADAMGGAVSAQSVPGDGTEFTLDLPVDVLVPSSAPMPLTRPLRATVLLPRGPEYDAVRRTLVDLGHTVLDDPRTVDLIICNEQSDRDALNTDCQIVCLTRAGVEFDPRTSETKCIERPFTSLKLKAALANTDSVAPPSAETLEVAVNSPTTPQPTRASYAGARVLAADDDPINREVLRQTLARFDIDMVEAMSGVEALSLAKSQTFDLIFMDGHMPDMDGFEATRAIRRHESDTQQQQPTPIVALTAIVIGSGTAALNEAGFSDVVSKPITLAAINACLGRWLREVAPATPTASQPPHGNTVLDETILNSIRDLQEHGDDLLDRMIRLYLDHAPTLLSRALDAVAEGPESTAKAAHALKSLSLNIGAIGVADICNAIETAARDQRPTESATWTSLRHALDQAQRALSEVTARAA